MCCLLEGVNVLSSVSVVCKGKIDSPEAPPAPKKPRLVFTDFQRRTLQAIFKVTHTFIRTLIHSSISAQLSTTHE
jgi:hypothetical protein